MVRTRPRPAQAASNMGRDPVMFATFQKLNKADLGPSEWYMFVYLSGLAQIKNANPFRTSIFNLRTGEHPGAIHIPPVRMAINTTKSSLEHLEDAGLISVVRTQEGRAVHLDITIN